MIKNIDRCDACGRFVSECSLVVEMDANNEPTGRSICERCDAENAVKLRMFEAEKENATNPLVCWAELVTWAHGLLDRKDVDRDGKCAHPPFFIEAIGGCYCGKFRSQAE